MHVIVLGAGVIGTTTAYALHKAGHQVTVIEREEDAALGTSYANAGQISPALSAPWAVPGLTAKALHWMREKYPPLIISKFPDAQMMVWLWRMWRAASVEQYECSKRAMVALGEYSRDLLKDMRSELTLDYASRARGTYVLFRSEQQIEAYKRDIQTLDSMGVPAKLLSPQELSILEPNLAVKSNGIVGAAILPGDETGDCHKFTRNLAAASLSRGVEFHYGEAVQGLVRSGDSVTGVITDKGQYTADKVIVCLGVASVAFLMQIGIKLPIYPLKGYSLTIDADSDAVGPHSTVADETYKIGVTYLGNRIRVGGTAELAGYDLSRPARRYAGLEFVVRNLYPQIPESALREAERWSGLRPMTPDGPPIMGKTGIGNLYINSGHGTLGWTMACGAAQVMADLIDDRKISVDISAFSLNRYA